MYIQSTAVRKEVSAIIEQAEPIKKPKNYFSKLVTAITLFIVCLTYKNQ